MNAFASEIKSADAHMAALYERIKKTNTERRYVFGAGSLNSSVMLIGEAPGAEEDKCGTPFCGRAGEMLTDFLNEAGIKRECLFITNAVKFRPVKPGKSGGAINRAPTKLEIKSFMPFLHEEISILNPKLIVTLGNVALRAVTGDFSNSVGNLGAQLQEVYIDGVKYHLFALYHPAAVIYNRSLAEPYAAALFKLKRSIEAAGLI